MKEEAGPGMPCIKLCKVGEVCKTQLVTDTESGSGTDYTHFRITSQVQLTS